MEVLLSANLRKTVLETFHLRFEVICGTARDRGLPVQHPFLQFGVYRGRRSTILASEQRRGFLADDFVTLLHQHVQNSLRADDLRRRRHQRDESQVLTDSRDFGEHLVDSSCRPLFAKLVLHVAEHTAGHLRHQYAGIHAFERAFKSGILRPHLPEISSDFLEQVQVQAGIARGAFENGDDGFRCRVPVGHADR